MNNGKARCLRVEWVEFSDFDEKRVRCVNVRRIIVSSTCVLDERAGLPGGRRWRGTEMPSGVKCESVGEGRCAVRLKVIISRVAKHE